MARLRAGDFLSAAADPLEASREAFSAAMRSTTGAMSSIMRLLSERDERIDPRVFSDLAIDPEPRQAAEPSWVSPPLEAAAEPEAESPPCCGTWPGSLRSFGTVIE